MLRKHVPFLILLHGLIAACSPKPPGPSAGPGNSNAATQSGPGAPGSIGSTAGSTTGTPGVATTGSAPDANCPPDHASVSGNCQRLIPVYRCQAPVPPGKEYMNRIYTTDRAECDNAGYTVEGSGIYFYALAGGDKDISRWYFQGPAGIQHYYLQPGERPDPPYTEEGPVWKISANSFGSRAVAIYRCVYNCQNYSPQASCNDNMQWLTFDQACEGTGTLNGPLGYVIRP